MTNVIHKLGLIGLVLGLFIATLSFAQPALDKLAYNLRAQQALSQGHDSYFESSWVTPEQSQADRLDGIIYGFGLAIIGLMVAATTTFLWPQETPDPQEQERRDQQDEP